MGEVVPYIAVGIILVTNAAGMKYPPSGAHWSADMSFLWKVRRLICKLFAICLQTVLLNVK